MWMPTDELMHTPICGGGTFVVKNIVTAFTKVPEGDFDSAMKRIMGSTALFTIPEHHKCGEEFLRTVEAANESIRHPGKLNSDMVHAAQVDIVFSISRLICAHATPSYDEPTPSTEEGSDERFVKEEEKRYRGFQKRFTTMEEGNLVMADDMEQQQQQPPPTQQQPLPPPPPPSPQSLQQQQEEETCCALEMNGILYAVDVVANGEAPRELDGEWIHAMRFHAIETLRHLHAQREKLVDVEQRLTMYKNCVKILGILNDVDLYSVLMHPTAMALLTLPCRSTRAIGRNMMEHVKTERIQRVLRFTLMSSGGDETDASFALDELAMGARRLLRECIQALVRLGIAALGQWLDSIGGGVAKRKRTLKLRRAPLKVLNCEKEDIE